jgi:FKBP-type peptidyl-prolyl cis-trans isomerase SlyD
MKIVKDAVVSIHYTLKDAKGVTVDSSDGDEPLEYLHGHGQIVLGLERALEGKTVGNAFDVEVAPKDGYGEKVAGRAITVGKDELPGGLDPQVGMHLAAEDDDGDPLSLWVSEVKGDKVTLDANHPLAGETLFFSIKVAEVRAATAEELEHGHAHGAHSHH